MTQNIQPVFLGADLNCYSMARAFHEAYGVISHAFGRWEMGETRHSRIVNVRVVPHIDTDDVMLQTLSDYAKAHPDRTKILMGCTDDYVAMIIRNKAVLSQHFVLPYIDEPLMKRLVSKEDFYRLCDEYDVPYPETLIIRSPDDIPLLKEQPFAWPLIIKPSSSIEYWKHPFDGMEKVYFAKDAQDAQNIADKIFSSGYSDTLIAQDRIPGADDGMRVLTAYSDKNAKVQMMCLGHVLLEEHTPKALGNHAAILIEHNRPLMEKFAALLQAVGYVGFSNFDIKYDPRDGQYKVFEINLRQGRSNGYINGAGVNLAKCIVDDWVLNKPQKEPLYVKTEHFWHSIPNKIVWEYTADTVAIQKAKELVQQKKQSTPMGYAFDTRLNPLRCAYLWEHARRYHKKYATYCKKPLR